MWTNLFDCLHFYYIFLLFSPRPLPLFTHAEVAVTEIRRKQVERLVLKKLLTTFLFKQHIFSPKGLLF